MRQGAWALGDAGKKARAPWRPGSLAPNDHSKPKSELVEIRYRRQQFAKLLGVSDRHLADADNRPELAQLGGAPEAYGPSHLSAYRTALGCRPPQQPLRYQLFLNFKGGTGK